MDQVELARTIARDVGYAFPVCGSVSAWDYCALFYSATARLALNSVWDGSENEDGQQTVEHFKNRIIETLYAYATSVPQFRQGLGVKGIERLREIAEEVFQLYWQTGCIYRSSSEKAHRILAAPAKRVDFNQVTFLRGVVPGQKVKMCGAGCYVSGEVGNVDEACRFWGFGEKVFDSLLEDVAASLEWKPMSNVEYIEYLNTDIRPGRRSYWDPSYCDKDGLLSLARYGQKGTETYVLYRMGRDGVGTMAVLPGWRYDHPWGNGVGADYTTKEYLRLAAAALSARGHLPKIKHVVEGGYVRVDLGYLLPVAEENFFRLYSWPSNFAHIGQAVKMDNDNFDQQISRVMSVEVFQAFRKMMEYQGYAFV